MFDGRYVAFVPGLLGWLEPKIVLWHRGRWTFTFSSEEYPDKVHGWIGPLPVLKLENQKPLENPQWSTEEIAAMDPEAEPLEINKLPPMAFDL